MIRTRDFLVFGLMFAFLSFGIGMTILQQSWGSGGQLASVMNANLKPATEVNGAVSLQQEEVNREDNINRLRQKIAQGEGDVSAGEPIFTSVDDLMVDTDSPTITDGTTPPSILIGRLLSGQPLYSDELWRFAGFSMTDQIGIALDGYPIYGPRIDTYMLDSCGGADEGTGYRYYLDLTKPVEPSCYGL